MDLTISGCGSEIGVKLAELACARKVAGFLGGARQAPEGSGSPGGGGTVSPGGGGTVSPGGGGTVSPGGGGTVSPGGGGTGGRWQPLGELVSVNLELAGLKGQTVVLSWSIYPENGSTSLPEKWVGNFVAYQLVATTDDDTGTVDMWIPLPRQQGPYFVRATLALGDTDLASMTSGPFG